MPILPDGRVRFDSPDEIPPVALSLSTTAWNATGAWRSREPVFGDRRPPCVAACPAGEDVVDQVRLCAQGRAREAGDRMLQANPLPAVTGRVCPHPCTAACHRARMDGAVDVPGIEREIGDALLQAPPPPPAPARDAARVAVVGAGPAGVSAAFWLARAGLRVTVYDRERAPGGLLRTGIPPYRLPRDVLDAELARALAGVRFEGGRALGRGIEIGALRSEHDAVVIAIGRHAARRAGIPGEDAPGVIDGLGLLARLHHGEAAPEGRRCLVVGGGNTAIDCARSLARLGRAVEIAYRRDRASMPAFSDEVEEAIEEGLSIGEWLLPVEVVLAGGRAAGLRLRRARPGTPDAGGRPRPIAVPDSEFAREADLVVIAAGEELDPAGVPAGLLRAGAVGADATGGTAQARVFACGDCAGGGGTVAAAIGEARRVAAAVAEALGAGARAPAADPAGRRGAGAVPATFDAIRPWYFAPVPPRPRARLDARARLGAGAGEVRAGFAPAEAREEAARCMACGTCTGCDNCLAYCADQAVVRGDPGRYRVDPARCKGCGVCVQECPRGAVTLRTLEDAGGHAA